jgi:hypothetical protein
MVTNRQSAMSSLRARATIIVLQTKRYWEMANEMSPTDPIVDSPRAYDEHYRWAHQHHFKRRRRFTLKASSHSFQPQHEGGGLIDIIPALFGCGLTLDQLHCGLRAGFGSKPLPLGQQAELVARWVEERAQARLRARQIAGMLVGEVPERDLGFGSDKSVTSANLNPNRQSGMSRGTAKCKPSSAVAKSIE